jgi:hypothetical protein
MSGAMDPHSVLGIPAHADADEVTRAYRELAKLHHPDHAPDEGGVRMAQINAAYEQLKRQVAEHAKRPPAAGAPAAPVRPRSRGEWLPPKVRRQIGAELLEVLEPQEPILLVADAATWDSPTVRLVLTDRRLLWLRDDAPVNRVRTLRYVAIERAEGRRARRGRAELRLHPRGARRISFAALAPDTLAAVLRIVRPRLASGGATA